MSGYQVSNWRSNKEIPFSILFLCFMFYVSCFKGVAPLQISQLRGLNRRSRYRIKKQSKKSRGLVGGLSGVVRGGGCRSECTPVIIKVIPRKEWLAPSSLKLSLARANMNWERERLQRSSKSNRGWAVGSSSLVTSPKAVDVFTVTDALSRYEFSNV